MSVTEAIKSYISAKGIVETSLAQKARIDSERLIATLNNGKRFTVDEYYRICVALCVPLDFFAEDGLWQESVTQHVDTPAE